MRALFMPRAFRTGRSIVIHALCKLRASGHGWHQLLPHCPTINSLSPISVDYIPSLHYARIGCRTLPRVETFHLAANQYPFVLPFSCLYSKLRQWLTPSQLRGRMVSKLRTRPHCEKLGQAIDMDRVFELRNPFLQDLLGARPFSQLGI